MIKSTSNLVLITLLYPYIIYGIILYIAASETHLNP